MRVEAKTRRRQRSGSDDSAGRGRPTGDASTSARRCARPLLERIAEETGGRFYTPEDVAELAGGPQVHRAGRDGGGESAPVGHADPVPAHVGLVSVGVGAIASGGGSRERVAAGGRRASRPCCGRRAARARRRGTSRATCVIVVGPGGRAQVHGRLPGAGRDHDRGRGKKPGLAARAHRLLARRRPPGCPVKAARRERAEALRASAAARRARRPRVHPADRPRQRAGGRVPLQPAGAGHDGRRFALCSTAAAAARRP